MDFVLSWEGGYVNDPRDPGGETKYGISKRAHPSVDIRNLTIQQAHEIYRADYWERIRGDYLPPRAAIAVMDFAVHSGVPAASLALQGEVGAKQDGVIGPRTIERTNLYAFYPTASFVNPKRDRKLAAAVVMERVKYLHALMARDESLRTYSFGWMRRTHDLMREVCS